MCRQCGRMVQKTFTGKQRCRKCYASFILSEGIETVFLLHDQLGTARNVVVTHKAALKRLGLQKERLVARILELVTRVGELEKNSEQKFVEPWPRAWYDSESLTPQASTENGYPK
jgi:hypothetical protein